MILTNEDTILFCTGLPCLSSHRQCHGGCGWYTRHGQWRGSTWRLDDPNKPSRVPLVFIFIFFGANSHQVWILLVQMWDYFSCVSLAIARGFHFEMHFGRLTWKTPIQQGIHLQKIHFPLPCSFTRGLYTHHDPLIRPSFMVARHWGVCPLILATFKLQELWKNGPPRRWSGSLARFPWVDFAFKTYFRVFHFGSLTSVTYTGLQRSYFSILSEAQCK